MSPQCLPSSFGSIWLTLQEQMRFEDFQDSHLGGHLKYQTRTILAILNLYVTPMPPIKFGLNPHYGMGGDVFWRNQDGPHGGHLGCLIGTNLAVLNLHVSLMPPTKFQLNPTYCSRAYVVSRLSSWPPWWPSWILEWNQFSNSKSPCHLNASNQGWAQSFGSRHGLKIFKAATIGAILGIRMERF